MQQLPGLRVNSGGIAKETVGILVPHDLRQFGRGVVKLAVADQIGLAARDQLLLDIGQRHHLSKLLRLAAGAQAHIDGHVVAGLPAPRIDTDPRVAQAHRLLLLAVLPDRAMQQRKDIAYTFSHDAGDQLDPHLRG